CRAARSASASRTDVRRRCRSPISRSSATSAWRSSKRCSCSSKPRSRRRAKSRKPKQWLAIIGAPSTPEAGNFVPCARANGISSSRAASRRRAHMLAGSTTGVRSMGGGRAADRHRPGDRRALMRAAIYARYSTENQREASIEDQVRLCTARSAAEGWTVVGTYTDHALSGANHLRPGYQQLLADARAGAFDVVIAEALDRLSRDQEHVAGFYKQLSFCGVKIVTIAEGEIGELHVGLKGTMNALFLKDLAQKTRRGLEGRVRQGRSGGGLCFGYDVVRAVDARGEPVAGGRAINEAEAAVVRRIFAEYAQGRPPRAIARGLNADRIPAPLPRTPSPSPTHPH